MMNRTRPTNRINFWKIWKNKFSCLSPVFVQFAMSFFSSFCRLSTEFWTERTNRMPKHEPLRIRKIVGAARCEFGHFVRMRLTRWSPVSMISDSQTMRICAVYAHRSVQTDDNRPSYAVKWQTSVVYVFLHRLRKWVRLATKFQRRFRSTTLITTLDAFDFDDVTNGMT